MPKGKLKTEVTKAQVRSLTLNVKPQVPVIYAQACKELAECRTLDDAKLYDNKADALAAWAKIYHDDEAGRQARALKLHAYAKMAKLAIELRPAGVTKGHKGMSPGPRSLLEEHGLSEGNAAAALHLARNPEVTKEASERSWPPSPTTVYVRARSGGVKGSPVWKQWSQPNAARSAIGAVLRFDPKLAAQMTKDEAKLAIAHVKKLEEWCDDFLRFVAKAK